MERNASGEGDEMAPVGEERSRTDQANGAMDADRLVKLSSEKIEVTAQDDADWVGVTEACTAIATRFRV